MSLTTWKEDGRPFTVTGRVRAAIPQWQEADPFGDLHIVVEDHNLDDEDIRRCLEVTIPAGQNKPRDIALCVALLKMTKGERWAVAILSENPGFNPDDYAE